MTLDEPLRDLLRERGATDDMLKWLEEPDAVREAFRIAEDWGPLWVPDIWQSIPGAAEVVNVDRNNGVVTISTTGATIPAPSWHRTPPVDRRPYPVRMAEERARRRARTR